MGEITPEIIVWKQSTILHLHQLPLEVLTIIFEHLGDLDYSRPLLDNLSPFIAPEFYKNLYFKSYPHFLKLCKLVQGSPDLAKMVLELRCDWVDDGVDYEPEDEGPLFDFFRSATSLMALRISSYPRLRSRLLSAKFSLTSYGSLTRLTVFSHSPDPHQYRFLSLFPCLAKLEILWTTGDGVSDSGVLTEEETARFETEDISAIKGAGVSVSFETSVEALELQADSFDQEGVVDFVRKFTTLRSLDMSVDRLDGNVDLTNLLAAVNSNLLHLNVGGPGVFGKWSGEDESDMLFIAVSLEFPHLASLHLYHAECSPALLLALSELTELTSLSFRNAPDYPTLHRLLIGKTRVPSLESLTVRRIPSGRRGISHLDYDYALEDYCEDGVVRMGAGWFVASHGGGSGVREILQAAHAQRIELKGNWSEAYRNAAEHEAEIAWCQTFRYHENYHLLRSRRLRTREAEFGVEDVGEKERVETYGDLEERFERNGGEAEVEEGAGPDESEEEEIDEWESEEEVRIVTKVKRRGRVLSAEQYRQIGAFR